MSESIPTKKAGSSIQDVADAFGTTLDPLVEYEKPFVANKIDPFAPFIEDILLPQGLHDHTVRQYLTVFEEWTEHMEQEGRHPACPTDGHVLRYIKQELSPESEGGKGNHPDTVKGKIRKLNRPYEYWQETAAFPHPADYNPFKLARNKINLESPESKRHRRIPVEELREMVGSVTNLRDKAIICSQFKLGMRAGEVANIKLSDFTIENSEIKEHYPEMGTEYRLEEYSNAIYIPPGRERPGNKSGRARMLPLDDELRRLLVRYLLVRPPNDNHWLFLSDTSNSKINNKVVNQVWKKAFHPEYGETEQFKAVGSHFGRHRFSTWWSVQQDENRELVKYMRGDSLRKHSYVEPIDTYLHTYYEDIEEFYRDNIYRLGI